MANSETAAQRWAAGILEAGLLVVLVAVPILFNNQATNIFDGEKAGILRSVMLILAPFLVLLLIEPAFSKRPLDHSSLWGIPLVRLAILYVGIIAAATATSILPSLSFWGSQRSEGLYTWLCYLGLFITVLVVARSMERIHYILNALLLGSFVAALFGILQYFGIDPINWQDQFGARVGGTVGNPIFLGSFLILTIPVCAARDFDYFRQPKEDASGAAFGGRGRWMGLGFCILLFLVQLTALVLSKSRGPFIGLSAAVLFLGLLAVVRSRRRWLSRFIAVAFVFVILGSGTWILTGSRIETLRAAGEQVLPMKSVVNRWETVQVRLFVWQGAGKLISSSPARWLLGYGPETTYYTYSPFQPKGISRVEQRGDSADRCHNDTFDRVLTTGFLGLAAETCFFIVLLCTLLNSLGFFEKKSDRAGFMTAAGVGAVLGWVLPYLILGRIQFSGIGMPAGLMISSCAFLIGRAVWKGSPPPGRVPQQPLLWALLVSVTGHYVEIQVGIPTITSLLCFWTYAALTMAIAGFHVDSAAEIPSPKPPLPGKSKDGRSRVPKLDSGLPGEVLIGLMTGLAMCLITFDLSIPQKPIRSFALAPLILCAATLAFGLAAAFFLDPGKRKDTPPYGRRIRLVLSASVGPWVLFTICYLAWISYAPAVEKITADILIDRVMHLANITGFIYAVVFAVLAIAAYRITAGYPGEPASGSATKLIVALVLLAGCISIAKQSNFDLSRANILSKQAGGYERLKEWDAAIVLRSEALRLQPDDSANHVRLAIAMISKARTVAEQDLRNAIMDQARQHLTILWEQNPYSFQNAWNFALLYNVWMRLSGNAVMRSEYYREAEKYYRSAVDLFPTNSHILDEWADFNILVGEPVRALEILRRSMDLGHVLYTTYYLRAEAFMKTGLYAQAAADYREVLAKKPDLSLAKKRLAEAEEALAASQSGLTGAAKKTQRSQ